MKNILVVFNRKSGKKKFSSRRKIIFKRLKELDVNFKFVYVDLLEKISCIDKYDAIIAVGGDGTVLSVLPYIVNTNKKLGIIPAGTANLFAASLSIPSNTGKALDIILLNKTLKVDIGKAGDKYFSLRVGMGYDANIINSSKTTLKEKIGYMAYVLQGIINVFRLSQKTYKLKIDGQEIVLKGSSLIIANAGNLFRNICRINPNSSVNDGKLDIFVLKAKPFHAQGKTVSIETDEDNWHIDGEKFTNQKELNINILPGAIDVLVP